MEKGLIHIYTGEGKGKTTAALGLAFRAIGHKKRIKVVQFLKGGSAGEHETAGILKSWIEIEQINFLKKSIFKLDEEELAELKKLTKKAITDLVDSLEKGEFDIYILDEIFPALRREFITEDDIKKLIYNKAEDVELILTGRYAPKSLQKLAHYVTVMKKEAHPFDQKMKARKGIEY